MTDAATPQPAPQPGGAKIIDLVVGDLRERAEMGRAKYGTYLQAHNGREALVDAYQECLDQAMYLRQEITEARTRRLTDACDRPDCDRQRRELQAALTAGVEERRALEARLATEEERLKLALDDCVVIAHERSQVAAERNEAARLSHEWRNRAEAAEKRLDRAEERASDRGMMGAEAEERAQAAETKLAEAEKRNRRIVEQLNSALDVVAFAREDRDLFRSLLTDIVTAYPCGRCSDHPCPFCRAAAVLGTTGDQAAE